MILGSFQMLSSSHGSLVEHFKQERGHIDSVNDIFKYANLTMTISNLGVIQHFDTLYTHKKDDILIHFIHSRKFKFWFLEVFKSWVLAMGP